MTVQCEKCHTKYRLDDHKVSEQSVKVRCAKCKHIFIAQKAPDPSVETSILPASVPELVPADTEVTVPDIAITSATEATDTAVVLTEEPPPVENGEFEQEIAVDLDFGDFLAEQAVENSTQGDKDELYACTDINTSCEEDTFCFDTDLSSNPETDDFSFLEAIPQHANEEEDKATETDFDDLSFLETTGQQVNEEVAETDDLQSNYEPSATFLAAESQPDEREELFTPPVDEPKNLQQAEIEVVDTVSEELITHLDFTNHATDEQQMQPEQTGAMENGFLTVTTESTDTPGSVLTEANNFAFDEQIEAQAIAPLVISSQKRRNPLFGTLIIIIGLLIFGALGYMAYISLYDGKDFLAILGKPEQQAEEGKIVVNNLDSYYLDNETAGEILVINGEALNRFSKSRASLQLKASVFSSTGGLLTSKTAYAGNLLTKEQLLEMEQSQIEAAMSNQFGDSLINLEVAPGGSVPFTIVIFNPPQDGQDFIVEAVSSTVASNK